jgi:adenine-specific DNA glycosylase
MLRNLRRTVCLPHQPSCQYCPLQSHCSFYQTAVNQHVISYPSFNQLINQQQLPWQYSSVKTIFTDNDWDW